VKNHLAFGKIVREKIGMLLWPVCISPHAAPNVVSYLALIAFDSGQSIRALITTGGFEWE
jgi:hypothetical protein